MFCARRVLPLAILLLAACDKKSSAPSTAAPPPGMPPLEGVAAAPPPGDPAQHPPTGQLPPGHPAMPPEGMPPGHPGTPPAGMPPAGMPPGHPAMPPGHGQTGDIDPNATTPGAVELDPKSVISGVLRVDDKLKDKVKDGDAIFMTVRQHDPTGAKGPILAVKKLVAGKFPAPFQLDNRDAMMAGTKLNGKVVVYVTVDKDGDAITKNPGDVTGTSRPLDLPSQKVVINLDTPL